MIPTKRYWITFPSASQTPTGEAHPSMRCYDRDKWSPDTDIYEIDTGLVIIMDIAGMRREDIKVTIDGKVLTITGQRREPPVPDKRRIHRLEIDYGVFEKRFRLPEGIDVKGIEARYDNGFLHLQFPKAQKRRITITEHQE